MTDTKHSADEQVAFEEWARNNAEFMSLEGTKPDNEPWYYFDGEAQDAWAGWQARAAIASAAPKAALTDADYQEILQPVLSRKGMQCYLNGDEITLDPSDYRAIIDRSIAASGPNAALVAALQDVKRRIEDNGEWWLDCPDRGGFDVGMIDAALAAAGVSP